VLAVIETNPIQSHAPVYRTLQQELGVPVTAIYGSDFSVSGYHDAEFDTPCAWDTDLLSGYTTLFLSRVASGGATNADMVTTDGLRDMLRAVRPAAVLIVGYSPRFHRRAWLEAWRFGSPILFRGQTGAESEANGLRSQMKRRALALAYRSCERVLYIGQRSQAHFRELGVGRERLEFSPYCVDVAPFSIDEATRLHLRAVTRRSVGFADDQIVLMFSGELSHRKGVDLLPAAVRQLPEPLHERIGLLFVGDGTLRRDLETSCAVEPRVPAVFAGFQSQRALSAFYHAADLLVLPSRHSETWGLVVNEALHHGLPCVVSDRVGCVPDLIEEGRTGQVCDADSAPALAAAIDSAQAIVGRASIRHMCRNKVSQYSVRRAAQGIARAYAAVVARAGAPA
jgi:glycosyltransferase involved in cell wall biosynthesis